MFDGSDLKAWRRAAGWTQVALAERSGIHVQTVKYWERQWIVAGHAPDRMIGALVAAGVAEPSAGGSTAQTAQSTRCGARSRKGEPCKAKRLPGKSRCKFHGGMSTGPKTAEGRQRIAAAQLQRWVRWRGETASNLAEFSDAIARDGVLLTG